MARACSTGNSTPSGSLIRTRSFTTTTPPWIIAWTSACRSSRGPWPDIALSRGRHRSGISGASRLVLRRQLAAIVDVGRRRRGVAHAEDDLVEPPDHVAG